MLDPELQRFVESAAGGRLTGAERTQSGASRATWLVDVELLDAGLVDAKRGEKTRKLVLRVDTGDGPMSGTELDLAREATVYAALANTRVRIPLLVAVHEGGNALLVERAVGSDTLAGVTDPEARDALVRDYFSALAVLHRLDPARLDLPGFALPAEAQDHARLDLRLWQRIARSKLAASEPLLDFGFAWLDANAPSAASRTSLCHGDAGPGNFLFSDDRVTALLDWEFAHMGDPVDDLAWVTVRAQLLGSFGDLTAGFRTWSEATGCTADPERLEYYRALVLLRMAVSCRIALAHAGTRSMDTTVYELLLPYLRALLPEALARSGCDAPELDGIAAEGRAAVQSSPVLRSHARPLDPMPAP